MNSPERKRAGAPPWWAGVVLAVVAIGVCLLLVEGALRWIPAITPHGTFGATRFDPAIGLNVHDATLIYNKVRYVRRAPNRDGFLDVVHATDKPAGTWRVGFFGDSYVEAAQVKLDDTFFRLLPPNINGTALESFGFGFAGWGTVHSLMNYRVQGDRYDLDLVVYLFVKNDPGDNSAAFGEGDHLPKAQQAETVTGYTVTGGRHDAERASAGYRVTKFIQRHSRLAQVVKSRLSLLGQRAHPAGSPADAPPDRNDLPTTWPPAVRADVEQLAARILADFDASVRRDGRRFAVLYVPRGLDEINGELAADATWFPWLSATCDSLHIPLIDPRAALTAANRGTPVYDDHWSPAGHRVIADVLTRWLESDITSSHGVRSDPPGAD